MEQIEQRRVVVAKNMPTPKLRLNSGIRALMQEQRIILIVTVFCNYKGVGTLMRSRRVNVRKYI